MSKQVKEKGVKLIPVKMVLQAADEQNFIYYPEPGNKCLKHGYPFWELKDGVYHFRSTPGPSNRNQQILWMKQGFAEKLAAGKLFVVSGTPVLEDEKE